MDGLEVNVPPVFDNILLFQLVGVLDIVPDDGILQAVGYSDDWVTEIFNEVQYRNILK